MRSLRFVVGAVDSAGLRAERSLVCLVDRSPPAAGYVVVPSGFTLGADSYAHDVAAPFKMCFNGFIDMHAGVKTIEYEVLMRNMTAGRRLSEATRATRRGLRFKSRLCRRSKRDGS